MALLDTDVLKNLCSTGHQGLPMTAFCLVLLFWFLISAMTSVLLFWFPIAAITRYHKPTGIINIVLHSHRSEVQQELKLALF